MAGSRTAHGHVSGCKPIAKPPAQCTPGPGGHKHTLFNNQVTCHAGDHKCPDGQHPTSTDAHGHVSGCKPPYVECPDGYQYGTGTLGSEPPYTAPAGLYWVTKDSTSSPSLLVPHTCWSLAIGSCPVGTTFGPSGYSPIRSNPGYPPGLPSAPDGKEWNWASGNAHYGCYKLVDKGAGVWNRLWSHLQTAYDWADYYLYTAVCGTPGARRGITQIVGEAASWRALNDARQWIRDNAATIGNNARKATNVVLVGLCFVADEPERPNSGSDAQSVPGRASGLELVAGDGHIEVSWSASPDVPTAGFGYRVVWKTGTQSWAKAVAASQFEDLEHGDDLATSYTITGLVNGSAYRVRVAAFKDGGFSKWIDATATPTAPPEGLSDVKIEGDPMHNSYKNETYVKVVWVWTGDNPSGFQVRAQRSGASDTLVSLEHDDRDEWVALPSGGTGDYTIGIRSVTSYVTDTYGDWSQITHKAE